MMGEDYNTIDEDYNMKEDKDDKTVDEGQASFKREYVLQHQG
jgi:hypothetical protein